jgi:hypothetical protein
MLVDHESERGWSGETGSGDFCVAESSRFGDPWAVGTQGEGGGRMTLARAVLWRALSSVVRKGMPKGKQNQRTSIGWVG